MLCKSGHRVSEDLATARPGVPSPVEVIICEPKPRAIAVESAERAMMRRMRGKQDSYRSIDLSHCLARPQFGTPATVH